MKLIALAISVLVISATLAADVPSQSPAPPVNPAIDMKGYLQVAQEAAKHRETRRLTEADFIRMSKESGTLVLDCRSREKYDQLHIDGAINLSFPDITIESLRRVLPDRNTRVLIYCNNNFKNSEEAFPSKMPLASLNISTFIALYTYGYRNVYELAPLIDPAKSKLRLVGALSRR